MPFASYADSNDRTGQRFGDPLFPKTLPAHNSEEPENYMFSKVRHRRPKRWIKDMLGVNPLSSFREVTIDNSRYLSINEGFRSEVVYRLTTAGFFAELNHLTNAIIYCLLHQERFALDMLRWNAATGNGWGEYFRSTLPTISEVCVGAGTPFFEEIRTEIVHRLFRERRKITLRQVGVRGSIFALKRGITKMLWAPTDDIMVAAENVLGNLTSSIDPFAALHIQKGDKIRPYFDEGTNKWIQKEAEDVHWLNYYSRLREVPDNISKVFVLSDDFAAINCLRENTSLDIYTLCLEEQLGHDQHRFNSMSESNRARECKRLIVEVEVALRAKYFIGTFSSNVSKFIALIHPSPARCFSLDEDWHPN